MMDWIMRRLGASVEELAKEQYEELMGYEGSEEERGHKPMRHDIQKLKELAVLHDQGSSTNLYGDSEQAERARTQWGGMTLLDSREKQADLVYREVLSDIEDPAATGWFKGDEDPFQAAVEVLSGQHAHWHNIVDLALRTTDTANLTADSQPLLSTEEARKLLSAGQRKKQIATAPKIFNAIELGLDALKYDYPESYKLWPWYVKQVKNWYTKNPDVAQSGYAHLVDIVGNAGKVIAEERRQNRIPQGFDVNKMDFDELEKWYMDYKKENRASESQGETVYQWDDGWTMQRLTESEQLQFEGDEMGHCVGDYGHHVKSGASIIYSLRDPKGNPHVTMELEGPELLQQSHDKPMSEFDPDDVHELELGKKMRAGQAIPTPLFENGQDRTDYLNYTGMGKENRWPNYLTERGRVSPHDVDENQKYFNGQGIPWDKSFYVVQVQGNSNATPKPEYQARVKEFMDYLKSKGFNFERSADWYAPHDDRGDDNLGGWEDYTTFVNRDRGYYDNSRRDNALGWYEHYQENPGTYLGDEDEYGIKRDKKGSGYAPGVIQDTLQHVLDEGEDPAHAARAYLHLVMNEDWPYADVDAAVRNAAHKMEDQANEEHETNWQTDNGTWMYTNPETGQDEEVEDYNDMPEESYFSADEDPKYQDGYKFINAVDQLLAWYYNNKEAADKDRHPSMSLPQFKWTGDNIPAGFREGTDPYAPSPEEQAKANQQAQQDAGPGFSTTDFNGVFSRTAETEHDPDYVFVYYMSELRVQPWEVNTSYEKIFEQLLDEFNVDLGNSALDIDPADVAAGEIRIRKGAPVLEHKQLCPPEIRDQAEDAIGGWWAKQWFEGLEHDWYAVDESHTLTGDGRSNAH